MAIDRRTLTRYREPTPRLLLALTAALCVLDGLAMVYQSHLRLVYSQTLALSPPEWVALAAGPFLVTPVLLFAALYAVRSRRSPALSVTDLLPGLAVGVAVGNLLGQSVGLSLWSVRGQSLPIFALNAATLTAPPTYSLQALVVLLRPLVGAFLVAVAALALADTRRRGE
ncbi:hypothetical protein [Halocalculus aciditolerans]|uniref:Uncharacterized protein n=1 Tax=Halocalculus aciditolerans TaxID=1383812 RepID=A0A830F8V3_9EURY|nr:hypothetical protein [Halocalculus aciditolerans]GGL51354.1 hypothetical protein GCM10009039_07040 [Halocalculus aciditolerans]